MVVQTGERFHEAELYRLKGELTLQSKVSSHKSKEEEVEAYFLRAREIARTQHAKSLELRAAMSLARLWQQQGKAIEARDLLQDIYEWFTEGFDTKDLQDAEALLVTLGGRVKTETEKQTNGRPGERESGRPEDNKRLASSVQSLASKEHQRIVIGQTLDPRLSDARLSSPDPRPPIPNASSATKATTGPSLLPRKPAAFVTRWGCAIWRCC
jgi:hypothetical protein